MQEDNRAAGKGTVTVRDLSEFRMDGVRNVRSFDDENVLLETELGKVSVSGNDLKIENLSKTEKTIYITGQIESLDFLAESSKTRRRTLLSR